MNNKLDWERLNLTVGMLLTLGLFILARVFYSNDEIKDGVKLERTKCE